MSLLEIEMANKNIGLIKCILDLEFINNKIYYSVFYNKRKPT